RLEHPVATVSEAEKALLHERLQGVELSITDLLGHLKRAASTENRKACKEFLLLRGEELVTPFDRGAQRLLTGVGVAGALQKVEALREAGSDLGDHERLGSCSCELDGERERVEAGAQLGDLVGRPKARARAEEV